MKLKNLFFGSLACLAFAACSNDDDVVVNPSAENGTAVIAVSFTMPTGNATRAWSNDHTGENYQDGETYEVNVNAAKLYFYKGDALWQAVDVKEKITNWQEINPGYNSDGTTDGTADTDESTDKTIHMQSNIFITLDNVTESNFPDKVVAVLNEPANLDASTLTSLQSGLYDTDKQLALNSIKVDPAKALTEENNGNFVMSNAVYNDGATAMKYTAVTKSNFGTGANLTEAQNDALANKIEIVVERVLARVSVDINAVKGEASADANKHNFATVAANGAMTGAPSTAIIANLTGWWLDNTNTGSTTVKDLGNSYTFKRGSYTFADWTWNDTHNLRSYWATAMNAAEASGSAKFQHYQYHDYNNQDKYCYENTNMNNPTQVVVAATLTKGDGTSVDIVQHNTILWDKDDFLKNVVYQLKQTYGTVQLDGVDITAEDLTLVWNKLSSGSEVNYTSRYDEVTRQLLTDMGEESPRTIKDYEALVKVANTVTIVTLGTDSKSQTEFEEIIEDVLRGAVKYWNQGQTYFYTEIAQLTEGENVLPGVIRNHLYKITINSVVGLGTPVPTTPITPTEPTEPEVPDNPDPADPDQPIIPETPTNDDISAIAAQINILEYRVVNQGVNLK